MPAIRRLQRNGRSKNIVIPAEVLDAVGWTRGDYILISADERKIVTMYRVDPLNHPGLREYMDPTDPLWKKQIERD